MVVLLLFRLYLCYKYILEIVIEVVIFVLVVEGVKFMVLVMVNDMVFNWSIFDCLCNIIF